MIKKIFDGLKIAFYVEKLILGYKSVIIIKNLLEVISFHVS